MLSVLLSALVKSSSVSPKQVFDGKFIAPFKGDFRYRPPLRYACGQDQEFWRKKSLSKKLLHRFRGHIRGSAGEGTSWNFQYLVSFLAWRAWLGGPQLKIWLRFSCFQNIFSFWNIIETCGQEGKVASSPQVLLGIFFTNTTFFWRYAELNRFWVGWTKFPLYELGQQERGQDCIRYKCE